MNMLSIRYKSARSLEPSGRGERATMKARRLELGNDGPSVGVEGEVVDAEVEGGAGVIMVEEDELVVVISEHRLSSRSDDLGDEEERKGRESVSWVRKEGEW
jgi:hypothetical protein